MVLKKDKFIGVDLVHPIVIRECAVEIAKPLFIIIIDFAKAFDKV